MQMTCRSEMDEDRGKDGKGKQNVVLWDYVMSKTPSVTSSFVRLVINDNNFEIQPTLITFVEKHKFGG